MSVINTNITSMIGQQNLNASKSALTTSMERLSSGLRINSAKDDAAGQAIANRMSSQITGLSQAQRNANDGISVAQTAEGALNQVNDNLQRIRELAVQAGNGTNSQDDLTSIQNEIKQRLGEINRISDETSFNGTKVLQSDSTMKIQVGSNDGESIEIELKEINAKTLGLEGFNVDGSGEVDNVVATADDLTLAGFDKGSTNVNGTTSYTKTETVTNTAATVENILGKAATGDTVTFGGTNNGTGTAASGDYTYDADSDSFSFDANDVTKDNANGYLTQGMDVGETKSATVSIGGTTQEIDFDRDGNIFAADDGAQLYLDDTGNLTKNSAGSPPAATLENLAVSMAGEADAIAPTVTEITAGNGSTNEVQDVTFGALSNGQSITVGGLTLTASEDLSADDVASAFEDYANNDNTAANTSFSGTLDSGFTVATHATDSDKLTFTSTVLSDVGDISTSGGSATATGGTITMGDAVLTADTAADGFDIAGATVSASGLSSELETNGGSIAIGYTDVDGNGNVIGDADDVTYTIAAGGAVSVGATSQYVEADGSISGNNETDTVTTYFAHSNGNVTDDAGAQVYKDADGALTLDSVTEGERTENALGVLDSALSDVDALRSDLGAIQNRMESAIENLSTTETNLSAARSRIEDADYATEVANMTRAQILQQAGTSVLAQANQIPQGVLSLLG